MGGKREKNANKNPLVGPDLLAVLVEPGHGLPVDHLLVLLPPALAGAGAAPPRHPAWMMTQGTGERL